MIAKEPDNFCCQVQVAEVASKTCDATNYYDSDNIHHTWQCENSRLYFPGNGSAD